MAEIAKCNCSMCKGGLKSKWQQRRMKSLRHAYRQQTKFILNKLAIEEESWEKLPTRILAGYTD